MTPLRDRWVTPLLTFLYRDDLVGDEAVGLAMNRFGGCSVGGIHQAEDLA
jgi:hypothetical protein